MKYVELDKEVEEELRTNINTFTFSYTVFLQYKKILKNFNLINQYFIIFYVKVILIGIP